MWQAQWHQMPAFLTQVDWPNWLAIVGTASAVSSIAVLLMQGARNRVVGKRERSDAAIEIAMS
jgi:negative regulator of sigma E activity